MNSCACPRNLWQEERGNADVREDAANRTLDGVHNNHYQSVQWGTLTRFGKILLLVKGLEHGRIHFHLSGPDLDCVLDLETLEVLAGHAPAKLLRQARAWAKDNPQAIKTAWEEQNG